LGTQHNLAETFFKHFSEWGHSFTPSSCFW